MIYFDDILLPISTSQKKKKKKKSNVEMAHIHHRYRTSLQSSPLHNQSLQKFGLFLYHFTKDWLQNLAFQ